MPTAEELAEQALKLAEEKSKAEADEKADDEKFLKGIELPDATKELVKNSPELLAALKHQIEAKRLANAEAKANRLELEKFRKAHDDADAKSKAEQGKFQELYEAEKKKNEAKEAQLRDVRIKGELERIATKSGIKKLDYLKLFDQSKLSLDDDFNVSGLDQFESFVQENPELFGVESKEPDKINPNQGKPNITKPLSLLDQLEELKKIAKQTQRPADLATYLKKEKECKEKKLI